MGLILDGTRWVRCEDLDTELLNRIGIESDRMGYRSYRVSLEGVASAQGLMERISASLQFPDYFGKNWDALLDMLSDLSWDENKGAGYVLVFEHAESLFQLTQKEAAIFINVCLAAVDRWQSGMDESGSVVPLTPFYVIFDCGPGICDLIEGGNEKRRNRPRV